MKKTDKKTEENLKAGEDFRKRFEEYLNSLSEEEREKVIANLNSAFAPLHDFARELNNSLEKVSEITEPLWHSISEKAANYETCFSDAEYEGVDLDLVLSKFSNRINIDDLCRAIGVKPSAMSKYKCNRAVIPADKLIKLSDVSGVSMELLLKQKERTLRDDYTESEIPLLDLDLETKKSTDSGEQFKLSKNLPEYFASIKAYRIKHEIPLFGVDLNPILIVDESFENPVFYGDKPFLGIIKYEDRYAISHIQRIGRAFHLHINNSYLTLPIEKVKQNIAGVIIKIVLDF